MLQLRRGISSAALPLWKRSERSADYAVEIGIEDYVHNALLGDKLYLAFDLYSL